MGGLAVWLLVVAAAWSCGEKPAPRPAAPRDAPARDVVIRTARFAIHANAYVAYYASEVAPGATLDLDLVASLGRCSDDRCAASAFAATLEAARMEAGLAAFLKDAWPAAETDARRVLGLSAASLMDAEDLLAPALAKQVGRVWPDEPVTVYLAHGQGAGAIGRDGPVLDTRGECFQGDALLECLFDHALERLLPESELGRAVARARAALDEAGRDATAGALPCVAALAADAAVSAAEARYRPTRRFADACPAALRGFLGDAWAKRLRGEEKADAVGEELVAAMAKLGR